MPSPLWGVRFLDPHGAHRTPEIGEGVRQSEWRTGEEASQSPYSAVVCSAYGERGVAALYRVKCDRAPSAPWAHVDT
jgi:hypothetical protein